MSLKRNQQENPQRLSKLGLTEGTQSYKSSSKICESNSFINEYKTEVGPSQVYVWLSAFKIFNSITERTFYSRLKDVSLTLM